MLRWGGAGCWNKKKAEFYITSNPGGTGEYTSMLHKNDKIWKKLSKVTAVKDRAREVKKKFLKDDYGKIYK